MSKTKIIRKVIKVNARNEFKQVNIKLPRNHKGIGQVKVIAVPKDTNLSSNAVYFGAEAGTSNGAILNATFLNGLTRKEVKTKSLFVQLNASNTEKYYFAWPVRFGFPSFRLQTPNGSFQGGFLAPVLIDQVDSQTGKTEGYYLYESIDTGLLGTLYVS